MQRPSPAKHERNGTTLVETTVVLLACLMFLLAIFEYGRFLMLRHLLDTAAREGARLAVVNTQSLTTADIQSKVNSYLSGQPVNLSSCQVYKADPTTGANVGLWTDAAFGDPIAVDIQGSYHPILPGLGFLKDPVTMNAKVVMLSEAN
jgi:Flp pilus assembly protein TadG